MRRKGAYVQVDDVRQEFNKQWALKIEFVEEADKVESA